MQDARNATNRHKLAEQVRTLLGDDAQYVIAFQGQTYHPSLCLAQVDGDRHLPERVTEVASLVSAFKQRFPTTPRVRIGQYRVYLRSPRQDVLSDGEREQLTLLLNNFLFSNLNYHNWIEDVIYNSLKNMDALEAESESLTHNRFLRMICDQFQVRAQMFRKTDDDTISSASDNPIFDLNAVAHQRKFIRHALDKGRVIEIDGNEHDLSGLRDPEQKPAAEQYAYIFPIRSKSRGAIRTRQFMLLTRKQMRKQSVLKVFSIDQCVEEYLYMRTRLGQQQCLYWQTSELTKLVEHLDMDNLDHDQMFAQYMKDVAKFVLRSTQGHSLGYLAYDAAKHALRRVVMESDHDGFEDTGSRVSLRQSERFMSAFVFNHANRLPDRSFYVKNINRPGDFEHHGLLSVSCMRNKMIDRGKAIGPKTISEAALVIQDQDMPVGVMSVECPYRDGLAGDLAFLRQVASQASIYWSFLFRTSDQIWLRRNLQLQDISHELQKLVLNLEEGPTKTRLTEITTELDPSQSAAHEVEKTLSERIDELIEEETGGSKTMAADLGSAIRVHNPAHHVLPWAIQSAAVHIVRNLLTNRRHSSVLNPIRVVSREQWTGTDNVLLIRTKLEMNLPENELRDAFRRPIRRATREHVGLYMIGVIVRTRGGRLDFDRRPGINSRSLDICIPFGKSANTDRRSRW